MDRIRWNKHLAPHFAHFRPGEVGPADIRVFAEAPSQWAPAGGSIEKLSKVLGHYSVVLTERYVHLRPDLFAERDLGTIQLDLGAGGSGSVELGPHSRAALGVQ